MLKSLISIIFLVLGTTAAASAPCFKDSDSYMVATYGSDFRDDENLVVGKESYGNHVYYFVHDRTSGTNHPVTLLMPTEGKGLCKVLTTYPIAAITPIKYEKMSALLLLVPRTKELSRMKSSTSGISQLVSLSPSSAAKLLGLEAK